jgi:hypothetical protein
VGIKWPCLPGMAELTADLAQHVGSAFWPAARLYLAPSCWPGACRSLNDHGESKTTSRDGQGKRIKDQHSVLLSIPQFLYDVLVGRASRCIVHASWIPHVILCTANAVNPTNTTILHFEYQLQHTPPCLISFPSRHNISLMIIVQPIIVTYAEPSCAVPTST